MKRNEFVKQWKQEEQAAFSGWDFSHLNGRWQEAPLPWDYKEIVCSFLKPEKRLLDMGTGGGEFLLTLNHPYSLTSVTEGYLPNLELCQKKLAPLGITVKQTSDDDRLPFEKDCFDLVINRHESFDAKEIFRVLKPGGIFITQQVGGKNSADLSARLIPGFIPHFPNHTRENNRRMIESAGLSVFRSEEDFSPTRFFDIGALVYYAKQIPWEFPGFSVDSCLNALFSLQEELEQSGFISGLRHRFLIAARK